MARRRRLIDKEVVKRSAGRCRFCPQDNYAALDVHRIVPGEQGGEYTPDNSVCLCAVCHRLVHDGHFQIDRYYACSDGAKKLRVLVGPSREERFY